MKNIIYSLMMLTALFTGCGSSEPQAINYGKDLCEHCKMAIADEKYGAELITKKGKIFKFDSAECLMDYVNDNQEQKDGAKLYVINFAQPTNFIDATTAFYLIDKEYQSPMGGNIAPFATEMHADNNMISPDAKILSFEQALASRK
ncbi:nitrous oxide reductase accessory protein NosL [Pelobium manganitolerans]|uniref:nitrous oxide reductase accessory protein NosL n=1 Tax=Pelobium manganitolerans TaxID=1842495 RepID=UPI003FA363C1